MGTAYRASLPIHRLYRVMVPALAGAIIILAGFLPWIVQPLQSTVMAWQIPVDPGWQVRSILLNYGLLCLSGSLYPFVIAYRAWKYAIAPTSSRIPLAEPRSCTLAAWLCCIPVSVWVWQYLFVDMSSIEQLTHQEMQYLLIGLHLGYAVINPLIPITNPLALDPLSLSTRFTLLIDQVGVGVFLPFVSAALLVAARNLFTMAPTSDEASQLVPGGSAEASVAPLLWYTTNGTAATTGRSRRWHRWVTACVIVLLLVIFGRAPLAFVCNDQARDALYAGDYAEAERWLNYASVLNPTLEMLFSYHNARGQAWYFLHPNQQNVDSRAYLASVYLEQKDYLAAYQELQRTWQRGGHAPWLVDQMSVILMQLATVSLPHPTTASLQRPAEDSAALAWFNQLLDVDRNNIFGQYMVGRIQYELHNYSQCEAAMRRVIALSQSTNVLSSAYTYLALSSDGQGDYAEARTYLLQAVSLDPKYRNNTAREELSGLR
jgi:tetratricopeptide (TPR) repeat protein